MVQGSLAIIMLYIPIINKIVQAVQTLLVECSVYRVIFSGNVMAKSTKLSTQTALHSRTDQKQYNESQFIPPPI
jgi:hypothetical protein